MKHLSSLFQEMINAKNTGAPGCNVQKQKTISNCQFTAIQKREDSV
jgi:hypothetical protein